MQSKIKLDSNTPHLISFKMEPYCNCRTRINKDKVTNGTGILNFIFNDAKQITGFFCETCNTTYNLENHGQGMQK